jgi:multiple antibiotic resistance protein
MNFDGISFNEILTVSFTLFAIIDMIGNIPVLASLRTKMGGK